MMFTGLMFIQSTRRDFRREGRKGLEARARRGVHGHLSGIRVIQVLHPEVDLPMSRACAGIPYICKIH